MTEYSSDTRNPKMKPKWSWRKRIFILLFIPLILLSVMVLIVVCWPLYLEPYRTVLPDTTSNTDCEANESNRTPGSNRTPEIIKDKYDLHFVEFDDQGWLHPPPDITPHNCDAYKQLDFLMESLNKKVREDPDSDLSIILYIHGWKHNAYYGDENVVRFRSVLQDLAQLEQEIEKHTAREKSTSPPHRKIVGIYVGWRGRSSWDLLENLTFWDRKAAALRVAQGSTRELLARLREFQRYYNSSCERPENPSMRPDCKIRLLLIGHSFGAWVLYSATSGWLIQTVAAGREVNGKPDKADQPAGVERFADLVLLLNPAFEGSRYEPLHRIAQCPQDPRQRATPCQPRPYYQPPVLIIVTSESDWATKCAFPLGRYINSLFEPTASPVQKEAITHTPGHIDRYITHELWADDDPCQEKGYRHEEMNSADSAKNYSAEKEKENEFFKRKERGDHGGYILKSGWKREFCGGAVLRELGKYDPNSLVWNVWAQASIMDGHNDITKPALISFIRQIYHELIHSPSESNQEPAPTRFEPNREATTMSGTSAPIRATSSEDKSSSLFECFVPW